MPLVRPFFGNASGDRHGTTGLIGGLFPGMNPTNGNIALGADIIAYPPLGAITTKVSAGFDAGIPPRNASMLLVAVGGIATTCRGEAQTIGGYAYAHADVSITIEEWAALTRPRSPEKLLRSLTCPPTVIFDDIATVIGAPMQFIDGTPFVCAFGMPIRPGRSYKWWINVNQSATCEGVSGYALAISNVMFEFPNVFFDFTNP